MTLTTAWTTIQEAARRPPETPEPLTDAEVAELDAYGPIHGRMLLEARAIELWEREIIWGRVNPEPSLFDGMFGQ